MTAAVRRPRRIVAPAESDAVTIARHVRHVAADAVLLRYRQERDALLLERVADRVEAEAVDLEEALELIRNAARIRRTGGDHLA